MSDIDGNGHRDFLRHDVVVSDDSAKVSVHLAQCSTPPDDRTPRLTKLGQKIEVKLPRGLSRPVLVYCVSASRTPMQMFLV